MFLATGSPWVPDRCEYCSRFPASADRNSRSKSTGTSRSVEEREIPGKIQHPLNHSLGIGHLRGHQGHSACSQNPAKSKSGSGCCGMPVACQAHAIYVWLSFHELGVLCEAFLIMRALLFGVCIRAPECLETPISELVEEIKA